MKRCQCCKQVIRSRRSTEISTRFHGHITWMTRELHGQKPREQVYFEVLLKAIEIEVDGGAPYPYSMVPRRFRSPITGKLVEHDLPEPWRTRDRTNAEMMTACEAAQLYAYEHGLGQLPEKYE